VRRRGETPRLQKVKMHMVLKYKRGRTRELEQLRGEDPSMGGGKKIQSTKDRRIGSPDKKIRDGSVEKRGRGVD